MRAGRGILACLCVAALALAGARSGLGGVGEAPVPVPVQQAADPLFAGVQLAPGEVAVRTTSIANGGAAAGRFFMTVAWRGELARIVDITVSDAAGGVLYEGSLVAFEEMSVGVLEPGESRSLRIALALPAQADARAAGLAAGASFTWIATAL